MVPSGAEPDSGRSNGETMTKERENRGEEEPIKVVDRRMFTADGDVRDEALAEDEDTPRRAGDEPTEAPAPEPPADTSPHSASDEAAGFEHHPVEEPEGVDFALLVNAMAYPALSAIEAAAQDPAQASALLERARLQIDLLDLLRVKCRGNLASDEESLLERALYQLRMAFVASSSSPD